MHLLGIAGPRGAGKDEVAKALAAEHEAFDAAGQRSLLARHGPDSGTVHGAVQIAFADPLKFFAMDLYGFSVEQLWGVSEARDAPDPRYPRTWSAHDLTDPATAMQLCCKRCGWNWCEAGMPDREAYGPCIDHLSAREVLEELGAMAWRLHPETLTRRFRAQVEHLRSQSVPLVVVTGLRHPAEAREVHAAYGVVWWIERPGLPPREHVTEHGTTAADADRVILNDRTLGDLAERVQAAAQADGFL